MDYIVVVADFCQKFGWKLFLLAIAGIFILGCLKWFGCFKKINDKYKKYVYFTTSCAISIISCTAYILVIHKFVWYNYLLLCGSVIGLTQAVYGLYEILIRPHWKRLVLDNIAKLLKKIISAIASGSLDSNKRKEIAMGLGSDILTELIALAKEKEQAKEEITDTVETTELQIN